MMLAEKWDELLVENSGPTKVGTKVIYLVLLMGLK